MAEWDCKVECGASGTVDMPIVSVVAGERDFVAVGVLSVAIVGF